MRMLLITTALAGLGLGATAARAEPVQLDENGLRAVVAGAETTAAPVSLNVNVSNPVNVSNQAYVSNPVDVSNQADVSNPVNVSNQVDVSNQVGTGVAVGVNAAVAAFSNNVAASGAATSDIGLGTP